MFGLGRFQSWKKIQELQDILPGDHVDVAYAESEKLFKTVAAGSDPISQITACHFVSRLPADVRDQVLLRCGRNMNPEEVVSCAKELLNNRTSEASALGLINSTKSLPKDRPSDNDDKRNSSSQKQFGMRQFISSANAAVHDRVQQPNVSSSAMSPVTNPRYNYTDVFRCYNCQGIGHIARVCPSKHHPAVSGNWPAGQL